MNISANICHFFGHFIRIDYSDQTGQLLIHALAIAVLCHSTGKITRQNKTHHKQTINSIPKQKSILSKSPSVKYFRAQCNVQTILIILFYSTVSKRLPNYLFFFWVLHLCFILFFRTFCFLFFFFVSFWFVILFHSFTALIFIPRVCLSRFCLRLFL